MYAGATALRGGTVDKLRYEEMTASLTALEREGAIQGKKIALFGHCHATEKLADLLLSKGYCPAAILDNNKAKYGNAYRGIPIVPPEDILEGRQEDTLICIVARAYAAMADQLKRLGYRGRIRKLLEYNSYADYSLSHETIVKMSARVERGKRILAAVTEKYPGHYKILCPFQALGDIYFMMSYLPYFLKERGKARCVICVIGNACGQVVKLFFRNGLGDVPTAAGDFSYAVETFPQQDIDELVQAAIYTQDRESFIAHQDRPYVNTLFKALYIKRIPLEQIYCCGVFGLPEGTEPVLPAGFKNYEYLDVIPEGGAVILSPYAKSVTALPAEVWSEIVSYYRRLGKKCFTNVTGDEEPLEGTAAISPKINEMRSVVTRAGCFVGLRSGLCDVLRTAEAEKIALFSDYHYCDTQWKAIDMYRIDGWKNIVVENGFKWEDAICRN